MALQESGQITLDDVNIELDETSGSSISLGSTPVRELFEEATGEITLSDGYGKSAVSYWFGDRGVFAGGYQDVSPPPGGGFGTASVELASMEYINIASASDASSYGDLSISRYTPTGVSNGTRGIFAGGWKYSEAGSEGTSQDTMDYITFSTLGNASDFGNLTSASGGKASCSNSTRGIFAGGRSAGPLVTIDYVTIATAANASSFGSLISSRHAGAGASNSYRGLIAGGNLQASGAKDPNGSYGGEAVTGISSIEYVTFSSTSNATSFGALTQGRAWLSGCSSDTRSLFSGHIYSTGAYSVDYVATASTANAWDFGDLSSTTGGRVSTSNGTRATFQGGTSIEYLTIATLGNSSSFGSLTVHRTFAGAASGD